MSGCMFLMDATDNAILAAHFARCLLALLPLAAPALAAFTTESSPSRASAFLDGRLLSILRSSGQYAYGSTLLPPF